jgi:hypothetical protein
MPKTPPPPKIPSPPGYQWPHQWRARIHDINWRLADPASDLSQGLDDAWTLYKSHGELAALARLAQISRAHPNLFPGEAGDRLLWTALINTDPDRDNIPPSIWAAEFRLDEPVRAPRNVFERETPAYKSQIPRPGRKLAYRPRCHRQHQTGLRAHEQPGPNRERLIVLMEATQRRESPHAPTPRSQKPSRSVPRNSTITSTTSETTSPSRSERAKTKPDGSKTRPHGRKSSAPSSPRNNKRPCTNHEAASPNPFENPQKNLVALGGTTTVRALARGLPAGYGGPGPPR